VILAEEGRCWRFKEVKFFGSVFTVIVAEVVGCISGIGDKAPIPVWVVVVVAMVVRKVLSRVFGEEMELTTGQQGRKSDEEKEVVLWVEHHWRFRDFMPSDWIHFVWRPKRKGGDVQMVFTES
jgi:hypothetical protein